MPLQNCLNPECGKAFDIDGFFEYEKPTIFYCECGHIYEMPRFLMLQEIPRDEVDLSGLENQYPSSGERYGYAEHMSRGLFILRSRWVGRGSECWEREI